MIKYDQVPDKLKKKISSWINQKSQWLTKRTEAYGYFRNDIEGTGTTYTQQQVNTIEANTNIPVSINYVHPIVSQEHALISEHSFGMKVVSADGRGVEYAHVLDKGIKAILRESISQQHNKQAVRDMLVGGLTHIGIIPKDFHTAGEFNLLYKCLNPDNITIDPNVRTPTNEDCEGYIYEKVVSEDTAKFLFQDLIDTINQYYQMNIRLEDLFGKTAEELGFVHDGEIKKLKVTKFFSYEVAEMCYRIDPETKEIRRDFRENYFPEIAEILFKEDEVGEFGEVVNKGTILKKEINRFVKETTMLGDHIVEERLTGYTYFPITTVYFDWGGSPYTSYGIPHYIKGMQDAMDKGIQLMILNGILTNNAGWTSPKGSIIDEDRTKWAAGANDSRVIKEYIPQVYDGVILKPEKDQVTQLSNFYPMLIQMMQQAMEYSTGINPMIQGDPRGANVDVFSSLQQYQSAAMKRINVAVENYEHGQVYIGQVLMQGLLFNMNSGYYPFFDERAKFNELKVTLEMINELRQNDFRVLAIPSEGTPTQRQAMATELMKIAQTTVDPAERSPLMKKAFELNDMRGFDEVKEEINEVKKRDQQIAQMQEQLDRDKELMKQYENRALNAEYDAKVTKLTAGTMVKLKEQEIEAKYDTEDKQQ